MASGGIFYAGLDRHRACRDPGRRRSPACIAMLFIFAVVWATDILAYFVGRAIGGPKLAPRISPGKDLVGRDRRCGLRRYRRQCCCRSFFIRGADWLHCGCVALVLSVCSQIGDLFESFIKRRFGVKDSSRLIPGHGGVMDRVDGLDFCLFCGVLACLIVFSLTTADETGAAGRHSARRLI